MDILSPEEIQEYREVFDLVDLDHGGSISQEELNELLFKVGLDFTEEYIQQMIDEVDENNDGEIQFEEFIAVIARKVKSKFSARELKFAFKTFENKKKPGWVDLEVLQRVLTTVANPAMKPEEVDDLLFNLDGLEDGGINYNSFVDVVHTE